MHICGLQKLSMVDYPGKLAATVFTGGCNLRCPFCHNALLVTRLSESPALTEDEVLEFLKKRRGLLDGVVLSGGEPLLQAGAADFLAAVRQLGFAVKLDTNGFYPQALREILDRGLADYVAMDIKNCRDKYAVTADNAWEIVQKETGLVFAQVLEDAGVYKRDEAGRAAFLRFLRQV